MQQELLLIYGNSTNISNSYNTGTISGGTNRGGIIAHATAKANINKCYNIGKITGKTGNYIGGIIGRAAESNITNSYNKGEITGQGLYVGGIMGRDEVGKGKIYQCYNEGNIDCYHSASGTYGGIAGTGNIVINQCYNIGKIKASRHNVELGGIAGVANESVANCYNLGKIEIEIEGYVAFIAGGIVGNNNKLLENCYNIGEIEYKKNSDGSIYNAGVYIGGISGDSKPQIKNVYSIGKLTNIPNGSHSYAGAVLGYSYYELGTNMEKLYYLKNVYSTAFGIEDEEIKTIPEEIETIEEMKTKLNTNLATLEGWEEDTNNINDGYPIFSWQIN